VISLQLCALELELARGSYENALARLDRILQVASRKEAWWVRRGEVLDEAGRCHEAREAFENARAAFMRVPEHRRRTRMMERIEARILTYLSQPVFSGGES
jgi:predicted negative regulator of RcsB-dependent stress response